MRAAAIQMTSGRDMAANLEHAGRLLGEASDRGAGLAVLPENFSFMGANDAERLEFAESAGDGPAQAFLGEQAQRHGLWIVGGTIPIRDAAGRVRSRSLLVGADGHVAGHYDKMHLFDVDIPGKPDESYRESATTTPGDRAVVVTTDFARIGMIVCYDLRFPALFHRLGVLGMDILAVPAAFTVPTGRAHWRTLLMARAIESLGYVIAAGQWGEHAGGRKTFGHSMIVGPWGEVLAIRESGAGVVFADLDIIKAQQLRAEFPALASRREI